MLRKYCVVNPIAMNHNNPIPTCVVIKGQIISSPDPIAVAVRITLAPKYLRSEAGSGRSRYSAPGRFLVGNSGAIWPDLFATSAMFCPPQDPYKSPITPSRHISVMLRQCQNQTG